MGHPIFFRQNVSIKKFLILSYISSALGIFLFIILNFFISGILVRYGGIWWFTKLDYTNIDLSFFTGLFIPPLTLAPLLFGIVYLIYMVLQIYKIKKIDDIEKYKMEKKLLFSTIVLFLPYILFNSVVLIAPIIFRIINSPSSHTQITLFDRLGMIIIMLLFHLVIFGIPGLISFWSREVAKQLVQDKKDGLIE